MTRTLSRLTFVCVCRVLGWVPGIITMVLAGVIFWITSITMHKYIMKHPQIKDICE
jgi:uncharacterized protein YneF (UPF0154 family)